MSTDKQQPPHAEPDDILAAHERAAAFGWGTAVAFLISAGVIAAIVLHVLERLEGCAR